MRNWYDKQVTVVQHGIGGPRSAVTGEPVAGPETRTEAELESARVRFGEQIGAHPLDGEFYRERSARWERITVPLLSAANWGGQGLHTRGNFEGFTRAASAQKWLEVHGLEHWTHFYTDYGIDLQKRFFACFLHGDDRGGGISPLFSCRSARSTVSSSVASGSGRWPAPSGRGSTCARRAHWTRRRRPPTAGLRTGRTDGVTFTAPPLADEPRSPGRSRPGCTCPRQPDADLFWCCGCSRRTATRSPSPARSTRTPRSRRAGCGCRTASWTRACPPSTGPYHAHDEIQPLVPGEVYQADVEIWPTSLVIPAGYQVALTVRGQDYEVHHPGAPRLGSFKNEMTGCGPFLHDDPADRPPELAGSTQTLWTGPGRESYLLLPVIPADGSP